MPGAAQNFPDAVAVEHEQGADLQIFQCTGCGLVQLDCEPVYYYREVIRAAAISEVMKETKARQFSDLVQKYALQGRKVIEIGCGRGEFLELLASLDVEAFGLEYSAASVAHCVSKGLRVTKGYLDRESTILPKAPFDAFLMLMFLEHMPDPNLALQVLWNNLSDDAIGLVEVPNFDMVIRNKLFSEFIADHLFYFTKDSLNTTLKINGFEILECAELRDDYVISAIVKKRPRLDLKDFYTYQTRITRQLDEFIGQYEKGRVAIWGAGHQALAIIALANIADKIKYVVDSAPFKQGKYTPATHLAIFPPEILLSEPVDAVIVIAGSYSDEIAGILRRDYDERIHVSILRDYGLERIR